MQIANFEEVQKNREYVRKNGTYDSTQNGKCSQCGNCCSNLLPMTANEINEIRTYIKRYNIKECKRVLPLREPVLDMCCPFLNNNKEKEKCEIYEVRPAICKHFICNNKDKEAPEELFKERRKIVDLRKEFYR